MGDRHGVAKPVGLGIGVHDRTDQTVQDLHGLLFLADSWDHVNLHVEKVRCDQPCQKASHDALKGARLEEQYYLGPPRKHVIRGWKFHLDCTKAQQGHNRPGAEVPFRPGLQNPIYPYPIKKGPAGP